MRNVNFLVFFAATTLAASAFAADPASAPAPVAEAAPQQQEASGVSREIATINEQILLLQARLKKIQVEEQISKKVSEDATNRRMAYVAENSEKREEIVPVIRSIEGFAGKMTVQLAFSGGQTVVASKGSKIPGGWTVSEVRHDSVSLKRQGETRQLMFGYAPEVHSAATRGNNVGLPTAQFQ